VIPACGGSDYQVLLQKELTEIRDSEMWRAGAARARLAPEGIRQGAVAALVGADADRPSSTGRTKILPSPILPVWPPSPVMNLDGLLDLRQASGSTIRA
jgi:hypothetical protein